MNKMYIKYKYYKYKYYILFYIINICNIYNIFNIYLYLKSMSHYALEIENCELKIRV